MSSKYNKILSNLESDKPKKALELARSINRKNKKKDFKFLALEGICLLELGLYKSGTKFLDEAFSLSPSKSELIPTCVNIFNSSIKAGRIELAIPYLKVLIDSMPNLESRRFKWQLAATYLADNNYIEAERTLLSLSVYSDYSIDAYLKLVDVMIEQKNYKSVEKYLKILEGNARRLSCEQLIKLIDKTTNHLNLDNKHLFQIMEEKKCCSDMFYLLKSNANMRVNDFEQCRADLDKVTVTKIDKPWARLKYYYLSGLVFEKSKNFDRAFEAFSLMNELTRNLAGRRLDDKDDLLDCTINQFNLRPSNFTKPLDVAFLIGSPRSGTTLLEKVLDSQKDIFVLGEVGILNVVIKKMEYDGYRYPQDLAKLDAKYLDQLRLLYFEEVNKHLVNGNINDFKLLVDKNPLYIKKLPLILALFPEAKILLALRHPLDCVFSCYQQNFVPTKSLLHYTDLKSSFQRYSELFSLYNSYRDIFNWNEHRIKYEDLVSEFEQTVEKLMSFLEINPDTRAYRNFSEQANKSIITTPSAPQVKKGIYKSASNKWQHYREYLKPHWKIVQPFISQFDYNHDFDEELYIEKHNG